MSRVALLFLVGVIGCDSVDNFDVVVRGEAIIEGSGLGVSPVIPQIAALTRFNLTERNEFKNAGYSSDDVDSIVLERLVMRAKAPTGKDLSFFGTVVLSLEAEGVPRREVARRSDFPIGASEVQFSVVNDDLKPYVLAKQGTLVTEVRDSASPAEDTTIELEAVFDVDVNVTGLL